MRMRVVLISEKIYSKRLKAVYKEMTGAAEQKIVFLEQQKYLPEFIDRRKDLIVTDQTSIAEEWKDQLPVMLLTENPEEGIFKYQKGVDVLSKILEYAQQVEKEAETKIYCVTSPKGGCGVTTVAMATALHFAEKEKVLYLDFSFPGIYEGFDMEKDGPDWEEYERVIEAEDGALLEQMLETGENILRFPNRHLLPSLMEKSGTKEFLQKLSDMRVCPYIIIDLSLGYTSATGDILQMADQVILVDDGTKESEKKYQAFEPYLKSQTSNIKMFYNGISQKEEHVLIEGSVLLGGTLQKENKAVKDIAMELSEQIFWGNL